MRPLTSVLCVSALLYAPPTARAAISTIDDVPAATLLLPYFEVDAAREDGATTLFSINNASATAVLAHVVVWSDLSVPVLDFNVYLTGYDVQSINLRDILIRGVLPQTTSAGQDPGDAISPQGSFSQDVDFASCSSILPPPPKLPADFLAHLQAALTGRFSNVLGGCAGSSYGDSILRGYVTVDAVNNCSLRFPGDPGYFVGGGTGDATNQNVLWGDVFYVNPAENYAQGNTLVHIEASATNPETSVIGQYTFYGRYVNWNATDNREALPTTDPLDPSTATTFGVRYLNGGPFSGHTRVIAWRDSKVRQGAFPCGTSPAWYPLGQEGIVAFDEEEHAMEPATFPFSPQPPAAGIAPFPAEAQSTRVGGPELPVPSSFGWLSLDLNTSVMAAGGNPPEDPTAAQAWVSVELEDVGKFSVGFNAVKIPQARKVKSNNP